MRISYGRIRDTTPAPEIMYKHAQGAQKGLTATKKDITNLKFEIVLILGPDIWNCQDIRNLKFEIGLIFGT